MSSFSRRRTVIVGSRRGRIPINQSGDPVCWSCSCGQEIDLKGAWCIKCHVCGEWMTYKPLVNFHKAGSGASVSQTYAPTRETKTSVSSPAEVGRGAL
jgi:hypothetical protein